MKFAILIAFITCSISGCASVSPMQSSLSSIVSTSTGVPQKNHYEYRGPYQFSLHALHTQE